MAKVAGPQLFHVCHSWLKLVSVTAAGGRIAWTIMGVGCAVGGGGCVGVDCAVGVAAGMVCVGCLVGKLVAVGRIVGVLVAVG